MNSYDCGFIDGATDLEAFLDSIDGSDDASIPTVLVIGGKRKYKVLLKIGRNAL